MTGRSSRRHEEIAAEEATASDPEDGDYKITGTSLKRSRTSKSTGQRSSKKRKHRNPASFSDDDDDDDEDHSTSDSGGEGASPDGSSGDEGEQEMLNEKGRRVRKAATKGVNYNVDDTSDEDNDEKEVEEKDDAATTIETKSRRELRLLQKRPSTHVIKLKISPTCLKILENPKSGRRSHRSESVEPQRRSSRIAHAEDDMMQLSSSGKHTEVRRAGTRSPERMPVTRPTKGAKGVKRMPSTVLEASQEDSLSASLKKEGTGDTEHEMRGESGVEEDAQVRSSDAGSRGVSESRIPVRLQSPEEDPSGEGVIQESIPDQEEDDEEDDEPISRPRRSFRSQNSVSKGEVHSSREGLGKRKKPADESSDFDPAAAGTDEEENLSASDAESQNSRKGVAGDVDENEDGGLTVTGHSKSVGAAKGRTRSSQRGRRSPSLNHSELDPDELAEEAEELVEEHSRKTRRRAQNNISVEHTKRKSRVNVDYRIYKPEVITMLEEEDAGTASTPQRRNKQGVGGLYRSLFSIQGPFGGSLGLQPTVGAGTDEAVAVGGADSDSSDDDGPRGSKAHGPAVGMTPTAATAPSLFPHSNNADAAQSSAGGAIGNLGRIKDRKALADVDPLGVDQSVNFDGVGGLQGHIDQLNEMVLLPLLYPEVFQRFHVTPPRGVLFHGPPGTGKTLLARALASSVSAGGKKVAFYMRKGADALSKWVGEAEKQLRLLFEEARKTQPSIIFFDEIDGLAPTRSSKQEQIHASIVATLLALMDGMDGRGQVIVIGATNRPDNVDPALRRPGRFDREFYFPLPSMEARKAIIDIHTKNWDPPLQLDFKYQLAELTQGYGGADLRALCTEAALNAVQGTYPQIYKSTRKLLIDPANIKIVAKDFMISVNKIIPSSKRVLSSSIVPLPKEVEPLLRNPLADLTALLDKILPRNKKLTPLEEAEFDDRNDDSGFRSEMMQRDFDRARVYRPRLLLYGRQGMGQQHLFNALMSKLEGCFIQSFDLASLLTESTAYSIEGRIVDMFKEVQRHRPSIVYIPNINVWYDTVDSVVKRTFSNLLRSIPPNDPVLLVGWMETSKDGEKPSSELIKEFFGYTANSHYELKRPDQAAREAFFAPLTMYLRMKPTEFPDMENRKRRKFPDLDFAPEPEKVDAVPTKEELKEQRKRDRHALNVLKVLIQPIMDHIKVKHRKFRTPVIDEKMIQYLYDDMDPNIVSTNLGLEERQQQQTNRPYEISQDSKGVPGLLEVASQKFYYNLDTVIIEKRLSNGYYKRPKDFLFDIKRLVIDASTAEDSDRAIRASELLSTVEVDLTMIQTHNPTLGAECEALYRREKERERAKIGEVMRERIKDGKPMELKTNMPIGNSTTTEESSGPIVLGMPALNTHLPPPLSPTRIRGPSQLSNGYMAGDEHDSNQRQSNGSTVPSRIDVDVAMPEAMDVPLSAVPAFYRPKLASGMTNSQSQTLTHTHTQRSQKSAITPIVQGSQVADYHNSASTTTSDRKTSDHSNQSSGNTNLTNGASRSNLPDFSTMFPGSGASELPDTQNDYVSSSQPSGSERLPHSPLFSKPAVLARHMSAHLTSTDLRAELGTTKRGRDGKQEQEQEQEQNQKQGQERASGMDSAPGLPTSQQQQTILDESVLMKLNHDLIHNNSGLSLEQLEQVNAALMEALWTHRHLWNRNTVVKHVAAAFNVIIDDISHTQGVANPSQGVVQR